LPWRVPLADCRCPTRRSSVLSLRKCFWVQVACLSLWPILLCAQSSDLAQNLADCKNGREACDRSKLSSSESDAVAIARHGRNVSNCRNGYDFCDHSKLSEPEAMALALADHQRNVSRSEEHTSELQSPDHLVCRLLLEN